MSEDYLWYKLTKINNQFNDYIESNGSKMNKVNKKINKLKENLDLVASHNLKNLIISTSEINYLKKNKINEKHSFVINKLPSMVILPSNIIISDKPLKKVRDYQCVTCENIQYLFPNEIDKQEKYVFNLVPLNDFNIMDNKMNYFNDNETIQQLEIDNNKLIKEINYINGLYNSEKTKYTDLNNIYRGIYLQYTYIFGEYNNCLVKVNELDQKYKESQLLNEELNQKLNQCAKKCNELLKQQKETELQLVKQIKAKEQILSSFVLLGQSNFEGLKSNNHLLQQDNNAESKSNNCNIEILLLKLYQQCLSTKLHIQSNELFTLPKDNINRKNDLSCYDNTQLFRSFMLFNSEIIENKKLNSYEEISLHIPSLCDIFNNTKGWPIALTNGIDKDLSKPKNNKEIRIGFLGDIKTGKTYLINHLFNLETSQMPTSAIQFIQLNNNSICIIDTPGLNNNINVKDSTDCLKQKNEIVNRDYLITQYVLDNTNIIIYVLTQYTKYTQKSINALKRECFERNKRLFVIHNVLTIKSIPSYEEYIKDFMKGNQRFLYVNKVISEKTEEKKEVLHFVLINENNITNLNETTIMKLMTHIQIILLDSGISIREMLINPLYVNVNKMFNSQKTIEMSHINITQNKLVIDIQGKDSIQLAQYDYFSYWKYANTIMPAYSYYLLNNEYLVVNIEICNSVNEKLTMKPKGLNYILQFYSIKSIENENDFVFSNRKKGEMTVEIKIPMALCEIICKVNKTKKENGIISLFFALVK